MRLAIVNPWRLAWFLSTSLRNDWWDPNTSVFSESSQKRRVGCRVPSITLPSSTSSRAICMCAGSGDGRISSQVQLFQPNAAWATFRPAAGLLLHHVATPGQERRAKQEYPAEHADHDQRVRRVDLH